MIPYPQMAKAKKAGGRIQVAEHRPTIHKALSSNPNTTTTTTTTKTTTKCEFLFLGLAYASYSAGD
jgi:hypothetical protein